MNCRLLATIDNYGYDFTKYDETGWRIIHYLCKNNNHRVLLYFLNKKIFDRDICFSKTRDGKNKTALSICIENKKNCMDCLRLLATTDFKTTIQAYGKSQSYILCFLCFVPCLLPFFFLVVCLSCFFFQYPCTNNTQYI